MRKSLFCSVAVLLAVAAMLYAVPKDYVMFVVGIPETFYLDKRAKVREVLLATWDLPNTTANVAWADSGWTDCVLISNTNVVWKLYAVSMPQIKDSATDEKIAVWKTILENNPQVRLVKTRDFPGLLEEYGLKVR